MQELLTDVMNRIVSQLPENHDWDLVGFYNRQARELLHRYPLENPIISLYGNALELRGKLFGELRVCIKRSYRYWETKDRDRDIKGTIMERAGYKSLIGIHSIASFKTTPSFIRIANEPYYVKFDGSFELVNRQLETMLNIEANIALAHNLPEYIMGAFKALIVITGKREILTIEGAAPLIECIFGIPFLARADGITNVCSVHPNRVIIRKGGMCYELSHAGKVPRIVSCSEVFPRVDLEEVKTKVSRLKPKIGMANVVCQIDLPYGLKMIIIKQQDSHGGNIVALVVE